MSFLSGVVGYPSPVMFPVAPVLLAGGPQLGPWQDVVVRVDETPAGDSSEREYPCATQNRHRPIDIYELPDVLLFSDIGLSLVHPYRVHKRGLPHIAFRRNYMSQLRALLPLPAVLPIEGGSPDLACSSVVEAPDVVCASPRPSRRTFARRRPTQVMETPVRIAPRLTIQDPLAAVRRWCLTAPLKYGRGRWTLVVQIWRRFDPCLGPG